MGENRRHGMEDLALHPKGTLHKIEPNAKMKRGDIGQSSCINRKANWDVCAIGTDFDHQGTRPLSRREVHCRTQVGKKSFADDENE